MWRREPGRGDEMAAQGEHDIQGLTSASICDALAKRRPGIHVVRRRRELGKGRVTEAAQRCRLRGLPIDDPSCRGGTGSSDRSQFAHAFFRRPVVGSAFSKLQVKSRDCASSSLRNHS